MEESPRLSSWYFSFVGESFGNMEVFKQALGHFPIFLLCHYIKCVNEPDILLEGSRIERIAASLSSPHIRMHSAFLVTYPMMKSLFNETLVACCGFSAPLTTCSVRISD